jgi:epidermal growth factor receptor substrate 15
MYFIQGSMTANPTIPVLPLSIPPFLWDQAGGRPPSVHSHNSGGTSPTSQSPYTSKPFTPPYTGGSMSALQQQTTGDPQIRSQFTGAHIVSQMTGNRAVPAMPSNFAMTPQLTGTPFPLARQGAQLPWDVTAKDKANWDGFFDTLDTARLGFVEGGAAVPFMLLSGLPEDTLARVWCVNLVVALIYG